MNSKKITKAEAIAHRLLLEIERNSRVKKGEVDGYEIPFRVAYFAVLSLMISVTEDVVLSSRESILKILAAFCEREIVDLESFMSGSAAIKFNNKEWREKISTLIQRCELLKESKVRKFSKFEQAKSILANNIFSKSQFREMLSKYRLRHQFASDFEPIFEQRGSGPLFLLDKDSYSFWYGAHILDDLAQSKAGRKELRELKKAKIRQEINEKFKPAEVLIEQSRSRVEQQKVFLTPEDINLLRDFHATRCPWMSFDPEQVLIALALVLQMDPSIARDLLVDKKATIGELLDRIDADNLG